MAPRRASLSSGEALALSLSPSSTRTAPARLPAGPFAHCYLLHSGASGCALERRAGPASERLALGSTVPKDARQLLRGGLNFNDNNAVADLARSASAIHPFPPPATTATQPHSQWHRHTSAHTHPHTNERTLRFAAEAVRAAGRSSAATCSAPPHPRATTSSVAAAKPPRNETSLRVRRAERGCRLPLPPNRAGRACQAAQSRQHARWARRAAASDWAARSLAIQTGCQGEGPWIHARHGRRHCSRWAATARWRSPPPRTPGWAANPSGEQPQPSRSRATCAEARPAHLGGAAWPRGRLAEAQRRRRACRR